MGASATEIGSATIYGASGWESGINDGVKVKVYAEHRTYEVEAVGKYETLSGSMPIPGTYYTTTGPYGIPANYGVRSSTLTHESGGLGTLRISAVGCASATEPYSTSIDINMQEVQKSLKTHPDIRDDATALMQIRLWEATPEAKRVYYTASGVGFRYYNTTEDDPEGELTVVTNANALKYLRAVLAGIETFNVYLPVVTRVTNYINLPGTSSPGTIPSSMTYTADIGKFDDGNVPISLSGYPATSGGKRWFKSADKFSRANDGSWTRTEEWTYTNDTTHDWIYVNSGT